MSNNKCWNSVSTVLLEMKLGTIPVTFKGAEQMMTEKSFESIIRKALSSTNKNQNDIS